MALLRRYVAASAVASFVFLLFLLACNLNLASASSGGVMGGSFFDSDSDSDSSSSEFYTRDSESYRMMHHRDNVASSHDTELAKGGHAGVPFLFLFFMLAMFLFGFYKNKNGNSVTVLKLQVAISGGKGSSIQRDLTRIAETADTSSRDGLKYLLTDTIHSLVGHLGHCVAGYSFVDLKQSKDDGEKCYYQLSNEERTKFDEETLVNLNKTEKRNTRIQNDEINNESSVFDGKDIKEERKIFEEEKLLNGFGNEYIVITILVAAKGAHKLPNVYGAEDMKNALQKLRTVLSSNLLAGKVLWTPQNEDETLSKRQLLEDYPQLADCMKTFLVKKHE
ncbi:uncharacterized protein LOC106775141 isoform X2 [Vigna radiata var. radiata]|nr:uncharacterized protein LOC106775141 isoform X2 [Vigna radiata var. radiata]XP_022642355.1 uncharacterized protein LOC106775141 isoform X2 [Vigna radiata var. radiata]